MNQMDWKLFWSRLIRRPCLPALVLSLWFAACGDDQKAMPERQLERPLTAGFFCARRDASRHWKWEAMDSCLQDSTDTRFFAWIALSSRGELAVVDLKDKKLLDLDPLNPGYNFYPVGRTVVDASFSESTGDILVLAASPGRMVRVHVDTLLALARGEIPGDEGSILPMTDGTDTVHAPPHRLVVHEASESVYVTFPGCQAMAAFDLSGQMLGSWRVHAQEPYLTEEPMNCPRQTLDAPENPGAPPTELLPMAMTFDGDRMFLGVNSAGDLPDMLLAVELDAAGVPTSAAPMGLEPGTYGFRHLRVTPETRWGRFLYAVTRFGDVRVVRLPDGVECETQADGREVPQMTLDSPERGCLPVGSVPRSYVASTPGIHIGDHRLIEDVAFFTRPELTDNQDQNKKTTFVGSFAAVVTWDGLMYIVNLDEAFDDSLFAFRLGPDSHGQVWPEEVQAHRIRNAVELSEGYQSTGRPRVEPPVSYFVADVPTVATGGMPQVVPFENGQYIRNMDGYFMRSETWNLIWAAVLPGTARVSGVADRDASIGQEMLFYDVGANFCTSGVRAGDLLRFVGCDNSDDCMDGYVCRRTPMQRQDLPGMCFRREFAQDFVNACSRLLASDREYRVADVTQDVLWLEPHVYVDPETDSPIPCDSDLMCREYGWLHGGACLRDAGATEGVCAGAPWPESSSFWCVAGFQKYEIRLENAFLLSGSATPYRAPLELAQDGTCREVAGRYDYRVPPVAGPVDTPFFGLRISLDEQQRIPVRYRMQFQIFAGFGRFGKDIAVRFPSWIGAGPDGYLYVTDIADSGGGSTYIGQFVRILTRTMALDADFQVR